MLPWRTTTALLLTGATVATAAVAPALVSGPSPFAGCAVRAGVRGRGGRADARCRTRASPNRLVAVYQQDRYHGGGARGIVAATSTDGGKTWRKTALPVSACAGSNARPAPFASDPWASVGPDGRDLRDRAVRRRVGDDVDRLGAHLVEPGARSAAATASPTRRR